MFFGGHVADVVDPLRSSGRRARNLRCGPEVIGRHLAMNKLGVVCMLCGIPHSSKPSEARRDLRANATQKPCVCRFSFGGWDVRMETLLCRAVWVPGSIGNLGS